MSVASAYTTLLETLQALAGHREEELWPSLLRSAVEVVPGAEGGAIIVRRNHRYRVIALHGYPAEVLGLEFSEPSVIAWYGDEEAWRRGEPRIAAGADLARRVAAALEQPNTRAAKDALRHERMQSIRANLYLPLLIGSEVAAYIHLDNRSREDAFTAESLEAIRLYALQATALLAAQNQRAALEARLREFETLEGLTQTLNRAGRQQEIVALLVQELAHLLNSPHVHVLLHHPEGEWLESAGRLGLFERYAHLRVPRGLGLSWASLEQGQVLRVDDAPSDPRNFNPGLPSQPHAQLTAPMLDAQGEPLGVLQAARDLPYTPFEERLLGLIANVAATALERCRKAAHLERQLRETQGLLHTVTSLAVGSGDQAWSELLRRAVEMVPGAEGGSIFVREGEAYKLVAQMGYHNQLLGARVEGPVHRYWYPQPETWLGGEPRIVTREFLLRTLEAQERLMDPAAAELFDRWGRLREICCSLCLPVVLGGEVQGFINLDNFSDEQALDESSVRAARNYALQIAALVANKRERAALEARLREFEVIESLTKRLQRATTPEGISQVLNQEIAGLIGSPHVDIMLYDPEKDALVATSAIGLFEQFLRLSVPRGRGLSWASLDSGRLIQVENVLEDPRTYDPASAWSRPHTQITAPLMTSDGQPLGVIHCARDLPGTFTDREVRLMEVIASVAATAFERAQAIRHLEQQLTQSDTLLQTVKALAVGPDENVWRDLLHSAVKLVPGAEAGTIFLLEPSGRYRLAAQQGYTPSVVGLEVEREALEFWYGGPLGRGEPQIIGLARLLEMEHALHGCEEVPELLRHLGNLSRLKAGLCLPIVRGGEAHALINLENSTSESAFGAASLQIASSFALQVSALLAARREREEREAAYEGALRAIGVALEARDLETAGHTDRVAHLAVLMGQELGLSPTELRDLRWGAYLHDLGKLAVPDSILIKPTELDSEQWQVMQSHTTLGYHFTRNLPFLPETARLVVLHHHERWDGTGYPSGLMGPDIPLAARIFAACDVFDALISPRPYKEAWTIEQALAEVRSKAGSQFDPAVIAAFDRVVQHHPDALRLEVSEPGATRTR
ncbi:GAF domain-containing protein [Calidithermus chliarophilus]|uniref:GAF domain-containing protein n=1 Tax=Calidithermus chliarophilus TaxID=52023 RepID=UPI000400E1BD|nr:GAF domain-containing protein [Calidithermus chliarophilus]